MDQHEIWSNVDVGIWVYTYLTNQHGEDENTRQPIDRHETKLDGFHWFGVVPDRCRCLGSQVHASHISRMVDEEV